jgi:hypothetical protein
MSSRDTIMLEDSPERQQAYQPEQREPRWLLELLE